MSARALVGGGVGVALLLWWVVAGRPHTDPAVASNDRTAEINVSSDPPGDAADAPDGALPLVERVHRLRQRLVRPSPLNPIARNPFQFAGVEDASSSTGTTEATGESPVADVPTSAPSPRPRLIGIAESAESTDRTAILSWNDDVLLVPEGGRVGQYDVIRIGADDVELGESDGAGTLRLQLP